MLRTRSRGGRLAAVAAVFATAFAGAGAPAALADDRGPRAFHVEEASIEDIQDAYLKRIKAYNGTCINEPQGILGPISTIPDAEKLDALMTLNHRGSPWRWIRDAAQAAGGRSSAGEATVELAPRAGMRLGSAGGHPAPGRDGDHDRRQARSASRREAARGAGDAGARGELPGLGRSADRGAVGRARAGERRQARAVVCLAAAQAARAGRGGDPHARARLRAASAYRRGRRAAVRAPGHRRGHGSRGARALARSTAGRSRRRAVRRRRDPPARRAAAGRVRAGHGSQTRRRRARRGGRRAPGPGARAPAARAAAGAVDARALPVGAPGRGAGRILGRDGARWWRSSGSNRAANCASCSSRSSRTIRRSRPPRSRFRSARSRSC